MANTVDLVEKVLKSLGNGPVKASELASALGVDKVKVVSTLNDLRKQEKAVCSGRGRGATWASK